MNPRQFFFYFITLAVLIIIYLKFSELRLIGSIFAKSSLGWLTAIIIIQLYVYYFQALNYRDILRIKDLEVKPKELYPMSFVVQFLNQALPSAGLSGQVFFVQYLKKYGLPIAEGIGRAFLEIMTLWMAMGSFFIISSILVLKGGAIADVSKLRFVFYGFVFLAIIAVSVFFLIQRRKRSKLAKWIINWLRRHFEKRRKTKDKGAASHSNNVEMVFEQFKSSLNFRFLQKKAKNFWMAFFWQCMILLAHTITLYFISFAIGQPIGFRLAFIVFSLVRFIAMVAFVPGALGVFEGSMTLILISFGVAASPALAMTLILRAFTFWFPMPIGWALYRWYFWQYKFEDSYNELIQEDLT
ncbi:MAG: flippase-like domain-containing protein [Parcubacteria group bacterium]|nr:flippase-like domain-containing protein [Parcubacteria group bacterium]